MCPAGHDRADLRPLPSKRATDGYLPPNGAAGDGEVEDYQVSILAPPGAIGATCGTTSIATACDRLDASRAWPIGRSIWTSTATVNWIPARPPPSPPPTASYVFTGVAPGTYVVRQAAQSGWQQTGPTGGSYTITVDAGQTYPGAGQTDPDFFDRDNTAPTLLSITKGGADPSNAAVVHFLVQFSEAVVNVDMAHSSVFVIAASGPTGASIASIDYNGTACDVAVNTGLGDGSLQLKLNDSGHVIADLSGNVLAGSFPIAGPSYTIDKTAPTIISITSGASSPSNAGAIVFTATYSEAVLGVDASAFAIAAAGPTGAAISSVTGSGTTYTVTVSTGSGDGTLQLNAPAGDRRPRRGRQPLGERRQPAPPT